MLEASAGWQGDFPQACRSLGAGQLQRFPAGDSSISLRIAHRSSVAEITGNRMNRAHPKASRHCREVNRWAGAFLEARHSQ